MIAGLGRKLFNISTSISPTPEGVKLLFEVIAGFGLLFYTRTTEVLEIGKPTNITRDPHSPVRQRVIDFVAKHTNRGSADPFSADPIPLSDSYHQPIPNAGRTNLSPHNTYFHEIEIG